MMNILEDLLVNLPDRGTHLLELESRKVGLRGLSYLHKVTKSFSTTLMVGLSAAMAASSGVVALVLYLVCRYSDNFYLFEVSDELGWISIIFFGISAALSIILAYLMKETRWLRFFGYSYLVDKPRRPVAPTSSVGSASHDSARIREIVREELGIKAN